MVDRGIEWEWDSEIKSAGQHLSYRHTPISCQSGADLAMT